MEERRIFTIQKLKIKIPEHEFEVDALVSEHGAKRVFHNSNLPASLAPFLSKEIEVFYRDRPVTGQFIKEITFDGVFYNIKFVNINPLLRDLLRYDVKNHGIGSPWQRKFARIPTQDNAEIPMPFMTVLEHMGQSHFLQVKNFTLGGLLLESTGGELTSLTIGTKIIFDILANNGEKISDVTGMVMHISHDLKSTDGVVPNYQMGIKITHMNINSDNQYRDLIREYCVTTQKQAKLAQVE